MTASVIHIVHAADTDAALEARLLAGPDGAVFAVGRPDALTAPLLSPEKRPSLRGQMVVLHGAAIRHVVGWVKADQTVWLRPRIAEDARKSVWIGPRDGFRTACVAPDEFLAAQVRSVAPASVPVHVIPAPPADGRNRRSELLAHLGMSGQDKIIFSPGRCGKGDDGHRYVEWAAAILLAAKWPVKVVAQDLGRSAKYVARLVPHEVFGRSPFAMVGPEWSVADLARSCDMAALLGTGIPFAALAALTAAGTPLVAVNREQTRELLLGRPATVLVEPDRPRLAAAALMQLIENPLMATPASSTAVDLSISAVQARWDRLLAT